MSLLCHTSLTYLSSFSRCLLSMFPGGLVKNVDHVKSLFVSLGGSPSSHSEGLAGTADIRRLMLALPPLQEIIANEKAMRLKESADGSGYRPMSAKAISDEKTRLSQMDRYVREMMRKVNDEDLAVTLPPFLCCYVSDRPYQPTQSLITNPLRLTTTPISLITSRPTI